MEYFSSRKQRDVESMPRSGMNMALANMKLYLRISYLLVGCNVVFAKCPRESVVANARPREVRARSEFADPFR